MTRNEQILKLADEHYTNGHELMQLVLVQELASHIERLEARLENAIWHQEKAKHFITHYDDCEYQDDGEDESCNCGMDEFSVNNAISINVSRQALTAPGPLDALLEGEK